MAEMTVRDETTLDLTPEMLVNAIFSQEEQKCKSDKTWVDCEKSRGFMSEWTQEKCIAHWENAK